MRRVALVGVLAMSWSWLTAGFAAEIGFIEDFVLAPDRAAALKQLVPGTEEYSYYHALYFLQNEQFDKLDSLLTNWVQRHGETQRVWEIRTRYALLSYDKNPQKSLDFLRTRLGLTFSHQREELNAEPNFPTALDQAEISREAYINRANSITQDNTDQFEDRALDWLVGYELNPNHRRSLLSRLNRPDYAKLVKQVIDDLNYEHSGGFGSLPIHSLLLIPQLEELLKAKPELLNQQNFVMAYLSKLQPTADEDWRHSPKLLESYLDRLWKFVSRLSQTHNSLKSHVLYQRLLLDRSQGIYNKDRFIEYLKLPRHVHYLSRSLAESEAFKRYPADLNANYTGVTLLPIIGTDEPLVRSYLAHFLIDAPNTKEFEPYINDVYLRHLFAEVKIVNGLGDPEQWAALLPPAQYQQLKERVDLDFAFTNKTQYAPDEPVKLDLFVMNAGTLIVKVFEINTRNYYRQNQTEIDTDINLDGLVANSEQTYQYGGLPMRRVARQFEFPQLDKPGVYVVDFIGNGQSSRALIRKGRLRHLVRTTAMGQAFTILDDQSQQVKDATIWLAGHEYTPDENGIITVPFSANAGRQPIVISRGSLSSLDFFQQETEQYTLSAGFYVDRESLLPRKMAQLAVRSGLKVGGTPISIKRLEDVKLTIVSTDLDGIATSVDVPNFELHEDIESFYDFQVPARLAQLQFTLSAKIKQLSTGGQKIDLSASDTVTLNGIDHTDKIEDQHLCRTADGYHLELRGRTGEAEASRPVNFTFKHRDFRQPHHVTLKTDPAGRIKLGALTDIESVSATDPEGIQQSWPLRFDAFTYSSVVQGKVGEAIEIPYLPKTGLGANAPDGKPVRDELSLLELRNETFVADRFQNLSLKDGFVVLSQLPAGDYDLLLKSTGTRIRIRLTDGPQLANYVLGPYRQLETRRLKPVQIESVTAGAEGLKIKLQHATKFTRVHLYATRYVPDYDVFAKLSKIRSPEPYLFQQTPAQSVYLTGRNIGDEYRYIIDRKYATKYPGNMLERPTLLLNPWAVRETETGEQQAQAGGFFGAAGAAPGSTSSQVPAASDMAIAPAEQLQDLNFLAHQSAVLLNLEPNEEGIIDVPPAALGNHQHVHLVAVDPLSTAYRSLVLPETRVDILDLRLASGLDPQQHFTRQKQISVVSPGETFTLRDITTSKFEAYDSLRRVFGLYATLNPDPKLAEFAFILDWPKLKIEEKRALYSKHASHELTFFLFKKDPEFFQSVIRPYLANKKDRTFVDRYLLELPLNDDLRPWSYEQLNIVEQILLGQRLQDERARTARHVADLYALLPPNIDEFNRRFETAIKQGALDLEDALGLKSQVELSTTTPLYNMDMPMAAPKGAAEAPMLREMEELSERRKSEVKDTEAKQLDAAKKMRMYGRAGVERFAKEKAGMMGGGMGGMGGGMPGNGQFFDSFAENMPVRQFYRKLEKTMEWAENNYHHLTIDQQNGNLITVNAFWKDLAQHDPEKPFLSRNLADASRNFPEMLLALAVLDLPFDSPKHETKFTDKTMTLTTGGPVIVFHEELQPSGAPDANAKVLVSQNFFRHGDRTRIENGEPVDKFVTEEFLIHTVYDCQVVVTNPTSARQKLNVLIQIPRGAIPVQNSQETKTVHLSLEPYHTQTIEYSFYFPAAGKFPMFPVHVARNETLIAAAAPILLNVVDKPTKIDTGSWDYISQFGSTEEVLEFLDKHNLAALNLDRIAWRMQDADVFNAVIARLTQRHIYNHTLWSYALRHNVPAAAQEFLKHVEQIVNDCGGRIVSTLLTIDPVARRTFEHLEYKPLVNARTHALGKRRQIVNDRFFSQYHRTLKEFAYDRGLDSEEWLTLTYYLLLQDRIDEAMSAFRNVAVDKVSTKMQYDYCAAYLNFFTDNHQLARSIATKYAEYPVDRWKQTFAAITAQLDEAEGKASGPVNEDDRNQQQTQLASTEPTFDFTVEARQILLDAQNVDSVRVNFYEMDVELLFSRNPFVQQFNGQFSAIRPNQSLEVNLKAAPAAGEDGKKPLSRTTIPLPAALQNKNVLVEIVGAGVTRSHPYYSNSLAAQVIENYGQVKVTHQGTGQPVPKTYVKVYAQMADGTVKFYKDGYTDLRGRFDYASLSTNDLETAAKFSILMLSDENGALVREAAPPKQ